MTMRDPTAAARAIVDANLYMVLGTADREGRPWAAPVYFAHAGYRDFFWVSSPDARHSRNIGSRSDVSVVIFDSSVPIGTGQGVYMSCSAQELTGGEREPAVETFSRRGVGHGGRPWSLADVEPPAAHRLYRATALEQYVLDEHDRRLGVVLRGSS